MDFLEEALDPIIVTRVMQQHQSSMYDTLKSKKPSKKYMQTSEHKMGKKLHKPLLSVPYKPLIYKDKALLKVK